MATNQLPRKPHTTYQIGSILCLYIVKRDKKYKHNTNLWSTHQSNNNLQHIKMYLNLIDNNKLSGSKTIFTGVKIAF